MGRRSAGERRCVGKPVAEYLLHHCIALFPEDRLVFPPAVTSEDFTNSSDTSLTVLTSQEEEEDSCGGVVSSANDEEDDRSSSSSSNNSSSSRSCTSTSEDTEGFRSPQLPVGEVPGCYRTLEETVSPPLRAGPSTLYGEDIPPTGRYGEDMTACYGQDGQPSSSSHIGGQSEFHHNNKKKGKDHVKRRNSRDQRKEDFDDLDKDRPSDDSGRSGIPDASISLVSRGTFGASTSHQTVKDETDPHVRDTVGRIASNANIPSVSVTAALPTSPASSSQSVSPELVSPGGSAYSALLTDTLTHRQCSRKGKRKEHVEGGPSEEHDAKIIRSTNSSEHSVLPLPLSCDASPVSDLWGKSSLSSADESASEAGVEESDSSAVLNPSDPWDDFSSPGEVYLGGVSSEDAPLQDGKEPWLPESHLDNSRRWSERLYPVRSSATEYQSPQHKSKRRKPKSRRHSKEGGAVWGSCESSTGDKYVSSSRPQSGEEEEEGEEAADMGGPPPHGPHRQDSLSSLLDHSEPAVTSDRGRWQSAHHDDHRTAMRYSRYDDEDDSAGACSSSWYRSGGSSSTDVVAASTQNSSSSFSSAFIQAVAGKYSSSGAPSHKNISAIKKRIKRFEEDFENKFGYKPSHSEKMKHKEIKRYMSDLSKARKELKTMKEGVADLVSSKGFSLSLLRCQESTPMSHGPEVPDMPTVSSDYAVTLGKVEDRLRESRQADNRPLELSKMTTTQMQDEKTCLQKALLYYESIHGRPNTRDTRELARPLYDRYRQVKRNVSRAQARAKENINELAPIIEHVAMDFTLASPQHRSSLTPDSQPTEQLLLCREILEEQNVQEQQSDVCRSPDSDDEDQQEGGQEASLSDSSDVSKQSSALGNLHSLPLHELKERRREAKDQKKKLRKSLRQFEERYEREHGHKLAKEDRGSMEQAYLDYKHAKAKLRLLEALIAKKAPKGDEF